MDYVNVLRGEKKKITRKRKKLGVPAILFNNVVSTCKPNINLECT
jgi:hypothetical protein